jgi:hypothetical protein
VAVRSGGEGAGQQLPQRFAERVGGEGVAIDLRVDAPAGVDDAGLTSQGLTAVDHAHQVPGSLADTAWLDHRDVAVVPVDIEEVPAEATGSRTRIQISLDNDVARDDVESAGEPQDRRHLCLAAADLGDLDATEFVLHC